MGLLYGENKSKTHRVHHIYIPEQQFVNGIQSSRKLCTLRLARLDSFAVEMSPAERNLGSKARVHSDGWLVIFL